MTNYIASTELYAFFSQLEQHDIDALAALRLIGQHTDELDAKNLSLKVKRDAVVIERRSALWIAAQDAARAENPNPEHSGPTAWYHIGDDEFTAVDVIEAMTKEERAELRARIVG